MMDLKLKNIIAAHVPALLNSVADAMLTVSLVKKIYITHPLRGDNPTPENIELNRTSVDEICREFAQLQPHVLILSPIHAFAFEASDAPDEYIFNKCRALLSLADELWVFGDWEKSRGCCMEIKFAKALGIPIYLG